MQYKRVLKYHHKILIMQKVLTATIEEVIKAEKVGTLIIAEITVIEVTKEEAAVDAKNSMEEEKWINMAKNQIPIDIITILIVQEMCAVMFLNAKH